MSKPIATPIKYSIHSEGDAPLYSEYAIHISVDDDGAVKLDLPDLELALKLGRQMIKATEGATT